MSNLTMDLTGQHKAYASSDHVFRIYKLGQYVDFEAIAFAESLKVYLISGGITTELVKDYDYVIPERAACDNDTSRAKLIDPTFDKELISGISMIRGIETGANYTISISYQRLYPNQLRTAYFHNEPLNLTPELAYDIVKSIESLKILTSKVTDVTSLTAPGSILLELDESYSNSNNVIEEEEHPLNVPGGRFMIHPKGGSFYKDSIVIKHPVTNTTLVEGKDYAIVGMDETKTKRTSSKVPVYNFLLIMAPIVDKVVISYHAFGGDPTLDNYREILKNMNNVIQYLNEVEYLTQANLGTNVTIVDLFERVSNLEVGMLRLQGTPAYGNITSGKCILMKLFSEQPGLHWYTIASLYKKEEKLQPCTADTFVFRLQSQLSHFQFTAQVAVDLSNKKGECFNVNVTVENYPRGFVPFVDYNDIDKIIRPQLRVVWAEGNTISGAYLQLGFELSGMMEETIAIEDMSGHETCWSLVDETATVTLPTDDNFLLPNGGTMWSSYLESAKQETMLVPFKKGHLIWSGLKTMNDLAGWQAFDVKNHYLNPQTDISKFTKIRLDIEEQDGLQFPVDVNFTPGLDHLKGHATFTHQNQPAYINVEIYRENGDIVVRLNYDITAGVESNKLNLRDMVIFL